MKLTAEEKRIFEGERGETVQKIMKSLVSFGDFFDAANFAKLTFNGHFSLSLGKKQFETALEILDEIVSNGLVLKYPFTVGAKPYYYSNLLEKVLGYLLLDPIFYSKQTLLEEKLNKLGIKSVDSFSSSNFTEKTNIPAFGDILCWSEGGAVTYANSVLGAKSNQNGPLMDFFCYVLGVVPSYGLLLDENRSASVIVKVEAEKLPDSQLLARAIAQKIEGKIPFVVGLERFLNARRDDKTLAYLKDFSYCFAANSNLRIFHINNITEEAKRLKKKIVLPESETITITQTDIEKVKQDIEIPWKNFEAKPQLAFIGSPHLSLYQIVFWANEIGWELRQNQRKKLKVKTVLFTSPETMKAFKKLPEYKEWISYGGKVEAVLPEVYYKKMYPFKKRIITNSLYLCFKTSSRFYEDGEMLDIISGKRRSF